ncbi:MAG: choice-of-anchor D domain-containing protein [Gammaproteobacteria bacterium]|nr:choice-of-anchor D domain-containing protein [Gammaproteobacteria bacterium]
MTLLLTFASLLTNQALASTCDAGTGTDVFGPVFQDTIWSKAGSPYCVTTHAIVESSVTLTIMPGVVVKFLSSTGNKYSLTVNGELLARGTESENIVFTSSSETPEDGNWSYIAFSGSAVGTTVDEEGNYLSGSILEHTIVEYGGVSGYMITSQVPLTISNSRIQNSSKGGVYSGSGDMHIVGSDFSNNNLSTDGGTDRGGALQFSGGTLTITDSIFESNATRVNANTTWGGAIYIGYSASTVISDSSFTDNAANSRVGNGGAIYSYGPITISNSDFAGNYANVRGGAVYGKSNSTSISNSTFADNSSGRGGAVYSQGVTIDNSTFAGNYSANGSVLICCGVSEITNSLFYGNRGGAGLQFTDNYRGSYNIIATVQRSTLVDSSYGIHIEEPRSSEWVQLTVTDSNIFNNEIYDVYNGSHSRFVTATQNYWGTTDESVIFQNIWDKNDDPSRTEVDFGYRDDSYLTTISGVAPPPPSDISADPVNHDFGSIRVGTTASTTLILTNDATSDTDVGTLAFAGSDANAFSLVSDNCSGVTMAAAASCTVQAIFSPVSAGAVSATLEIGSHHTVVPLTGNGYAFWVSGNVTTTVAGHDNLDVIGATISLEGTNHSTMTDENGAFLLELPPSLPTGSYSLVVTYPDLTNRETWSILLTNGVPQEMGNMSRPLPKIGDTDEDGVIDDWDKCADTAPDSLVDPDGCPGEVKKQVIVIPIM